MSCSNRNRPFGVKIAALSCGSLSVAGFVLLVLPGSDFLSLAASCLQYSACVEQRSAQLLSGGLITVWMTVYSLRFAQLSKRIYEGRHSTVVPATVWLFSLHASFLHFTGYAMANARFLLGVWIVQCVPLYQRGSRLYLGGIRVAPIRFMFDLVVQACLFVTWVAAHQLLT